MPPLREGCAPCGQPDGSGGAEVENSECCPCTDVPLPADEGEPQVRCNADTSIAVPLAPALGLVVIDFVGAEAVPLAHRDAPPTRESVDRIRTVVLRV